MRFYKHVKRANRELLEKQFKEYVRNNPMSKKEIRELREWVADGNSPYDNDICLCDEYAIPLDYITSLRMMDELAENENKYQFSYQYNTQTDSIAICLNFDDLDDIDEINKINKINEFNKPNEIYDIDEDDLPF